MWQTILKVGATVIAVVEFLLPFRHQISQLFPQLADTIARLESLWEQGQDKADNYLDEIKPEIVAAEKAFYEMGEVCFTGQRLCRGLLDASMDDKVDVGEIALIKARTELMIRAVGRLVTSDGEPIPEMETLILRLKSA